MLSLMNRALEPDSSIRDKITYLNSIKYLQTIRADETQVQSVVETIQELVASSATRFSGLVLLQVAVDQNPEICFKGHWHVILQKILKDPESYLLKIEACKSSKLILSQMAKDPTQNLEIVQKYISFLIPVLLETVNDNEWILPAFECLSTCVKSFPTECKPYKDHILMFILQNVDSVSSATFEPLAECFSELPNCARIQDPKIYQDIWSTQYSTTLNTLHYILNNFVIFSSEETNKSTPMDGCDYFPLDQLPSGVYPAYMKLVRQFINLCKCLAKMLSTKTRHAVQVPIKDTLECISRLFQVEDFAKLNDTTVENQILMSTFSQMQIAALIVLEPLVLNFNIAPHSYFVCRLAFLALQASVLRNISSEDISAIRHVVWKLLNVWLSVHTSKAAFEICRHRSVVDELLRDIDIEGTAFQKDEYAKKEIATNSDRKNGMRNICKESVCKEALKVLEMLIYSGVTFLTKKLTDEILSRVVYIAYAIHPSHEPPFPYTNEMCRKHLYELLLALTVVSKPDHCDSVLAASAIFNNALRDASIEVTSVSLKATAVSRLFLHPKKPPPLLKDLEEKKKSDISSAMVKFADWSPEEKYVIAPVESISSVSENITPRVAQAFHHPTEKEMHSNDFMQVDVHYSEQAAEGQCNGDDILEIQNSSQCQDEESEEDEEDEEEDEDDRSFCDEEINEDMRRRQVFIPTMTDLQVMTPVHIAPESAHQNVTEQEFEELKPCEKTANVDDANEDNTSKNPQLNGVPDDEEQSESAQNITNENGIYNSDEEEVDEEEVDEEEEISHPAEKKAPPELYGVPAKKPKMDIDEVNSEIKEDEDVEEQPRSPTLVEMKADFILAEVDDVKS